MESENKTKRQAISVKNKGHKMLMCFKRVKYRELNCTHWYLRTNFYLVATDPFSSQFYQ